MTWLRERMFFSLLFNTLAYASPPRIHGHCDHNDQNFGAERGDLHVELETAWFTFAENVIPCELTLDWLSWTELIPSPRP